jgi:four helix bundle protein
METETLVMLATRLGYITEERTAPTLNLITEIDKMLVSLRRRLVP